jgi:hypothetical protein
MKSKIVWKTTTFCYTFKLTSTFIQTLKVTSALPLKLRKHQKEGATSATSAASSFKVHSRHTLLDRK